MTEQLHPKFLKQFRGLFLRTRVDFMIPVASPHAQGRVQPGKFLDAILERVRTSGNEIACHDDQIAAQFIGHADSAADLRGGPAYAPYRMEE